MANVSKTMIEKYLWTQHGIKYLTLKVNIANRR